MDKFIQLFIVASAFQDIFTFCLNPKIIYLPIFFYYLMILFSLNSFIYQEFISL